MSELGDLLELIHGTGPRYSTARGRLRTWSHHERASAAFGLLAERSGATTYGGGRWRGPEEITDEVAFFIDGERAREERSGGRYAVKAGATWWRWDPEQGAVSNEGDPQVGTAVAEEARVMLEPGALLGELLFTPAGRGEVAGRAAALARAAARHGELSPGELHHLGLGADVYELAFDAGRGVLLSSVALAGGAPFHRVEMLELELDVEIDPGLFAFEAPPGEEIQRPATGAPVEWVSVTEAQRRAPFTVLIPESVPEGWGLKCGYARASERHRLSEAVFLHYRSDSSHEDVSITLYAAAKLPEDFEWMTEDEDWERVDGVSVRQRGHQAHAYLERHGTFASLLSNTLGREELVALARRLVPAPSESGLEV